MNLRSIVPIRNFLYNAMIFSFLNSNEGTFFSNLVILRVFNSHLIFREECKDLGQTCTERFSKVIKRIFIV